MSTKPDEIELALQAIGPLDGRYRLRTRALSRYFSEFALIRYRVRIEVEWYLFLAANPDFGALAPLAPEATAKLRALAENLSLNDARRVKELEATTNHDVKAVEYFLKERFQSFDGDLPLEMVHFACTSEDINNLSYALILKEFINAELIPQLRRVIGILSSFAHHFKNVAMMALTHGQPATPTTMGKEFAVFAHRLERQLGHLSRREYLGKINGAVGNFNAHLFACPELDWIELSRRFVESLGLTWNPLTTQIESHDFMAELFDNLTRVGSVVLDLARDMWGYISIGYFKQRAVAGEVGSSTMPHKVNPIDFENCEGNLGLAAALFQHLALKLPVSRWQRDLSDSTVLRSIGTAIGHLVLALASLERGLSLVELDRAAIDARLDDPQAWEVLAEALQTLMRRHGRPRPYERLKELTRGRVVDRGAIAEFIDSLNLDEESRRRARELSPRTYTGLAATLVDRFAPREPIQ